MKVVLITGISGSGKSIAVKALEDDGYYCIDNLPLQFLQEAVMVVQGQGLDRVAIAIDARTRDINDLPTIANGLSRFGHDVKIIFLNARTDVLIQRYSESRRRHPLSMQAEPGEQPQTLWESIEREREVMANMQDFSNLVDTSDMHPNSLRKWLRELVGSERSALTVVFQSFAYKYGIPLDSDLVFDARCLPNPYYNPDLRPLTGRDAAVASFLESNPTVVAMTEDIARFLTTWLPNYLQENRSYLTIGIGCTGGQHRSVYLAEELSKRFARTQSVIVRHRAIQMREASPITGTQTQ
ncbi:MAG: RNase adapter RapZ [Burkholderiaceae bacterium]